MTTRAGQWWRQEDGLPYAEKTTEGAGVVAPAMMAGLNSYSPAPVPQGSSHTGQEPGVLFWGLVLAHVFSAAV